MTAVAKRDQLRTLAGLLRSKEDSLAAVLPRGMTADRMIKIAVSAASRTPKLLECSPASVAMAVSVACSLGLEPGGALGHAYLVPYYNRKSGNMEAQFIPGYRGLIDLARRSGEIDSIEARVVYERDHFELEFGLDDRLVHRPCLDGERGPIRLVYAIARLKSARPQVEVMTLDEIEKIRRLSKSGDYGPWKEHFEEMARKTVIRRLCKYLPLSVEMAQAVELDNLAAAGESQRGVSDSIEVVFEDVDGEEEAAPTQERVEAAKEALRSARPNGGRKKNGTGSNRLTELADRVDELARKGVVKNVDGWLDRLNACKSGRDFDAASTELDDLEDAWHREQAASDSKK